MTTKIYTNSLKISGCKVEKENPLPYFRNSNYNMEVETHEDFPEKYKNLLGNSCGYRVLPYLKQERYTRKKEKLALKTIVMENDLIKTEFLCEYGGRLISLFDKKADKELLYKNPVFQPANLAIRNAWFSGGIEWNVGQYGHAFTTCESLFFAKIESEKSSFLRMYNYERCKNFFWTIDFHLHETIPMLFVHVSIHNINDYEIPLYYWTNVAIPETKNTRIFSPSEHCIYIDPFVEDGKKKFGYGTLPKLPTFPDLDASFPLNSPYSNEYFFTCDNLKMPWEVACEKDGTAFFDVSTDKLKYRKMFCWGNGSGGRNWQEFLSVKDSAYVEVQAGLAPTQLHGIQMPKNTVWSWTQGFGQLEQLDITKVYQEKYVVAKEYLSQQIPQKISEKNLYDLHEKYEKDAQIQTSPDNLLHCGSGWGNLEIERRKLTGENVPPKTFIFPAESISHVQKPWLNLLKNGALPVKKSDELPFHFEVSDFWIEKLKTNLQKSTEKTALWNIYHHLGVIYLEKNMITKAQEMWKKSLEHQKSCWVFRHLGYVAIMQKSWKEACSWYEQALTMPAAFIDAAITEEYYFVLLQLKNYSNLVEHYSTLLELDAIKDSDKILASYGLALAKLGKCERAEAILEHDFADIREGETPLTDIWFEIAAQKRAKKLQSPISDEIRLWVLQNCTPPQKIDFRMKNNAKTV